MNRVTFWKSIVSSGRLLHTWLRDAGLYGITYILFRIYSVLFDNAIVPATKLTSKQMKGDNQMNSRVASGLYIIGACSFVTP